MNPYESQENERQARGEYDEDLVPVLERSIAARKAQKWLIRAVPLIHAIVEGMDYDPGHSDLDDEQPIHVSMTLGEYRKARMLSWELDKL